MTSKTISFNIVLRSLLLLMTMGVGSLYAVSQVDDHSKQPASAAGSTRHAVIDVRGTWSGTFFSKDSNVAAFTMTVVINPDSGGHLIGSSSLNSDCLKGAQLDVTVTGSKVVLAGSDEEGNNITVRGTVDKTGTLLKSTYIVDGSATGRCETETGTGTLAKR